MKQLKKNEAFEYQKLTPDEMTQKGILGRLVGICADVNGATRNGRKYGEELWERVFSDPIVVEKIKNKCLFGEFGHPFDDREEVDPEKIAIALNEVPQKNSDGKLVACFDILATPCGKILKTLCDYGTTIGISSRGTGDVMDNNEVDPETYNFECFDAVIVPAVESARLQYVKESLDKESKSLAVALTEALEKATDEDKKIMKEQLEELDIKLESPLNEEIKNFKAEDQECINESCTDKSAEETSEKQNLEESKEAGNSGSEDLFESLQEALTENSNLKAEVLELKEKLAASDARVITITEEAEKFKKVSVNLSTKAFEAKELSKENTSLKEELSAKEEIIKSQESELAKLNESKEADSKTSKSLTESISAKDKEISTLNESLTSLKESHLKEISELKESFESEKADLSKKLEESISESQSKSKLVENYKSLAKGAVDAYISAKAMMIDVDASQIKSRLGKTYKLSDIDRICEDLQDYSLRMSRLPHVDRNIKIKFTESKNDNMNLVSSIDDEVDEQALKLANIK